MTRRLLFWFFSPSVNTKHTQVLERKTESTLEKCVDYRVNEKKKKQIDDDPDRLIYNRIPGPVERRWYQNFMFYSAFVYV